MHWRSTGEVTVFEVEVTAVELDTKVIWLLVELVRDSVVVIPRTFMRSLME